MDNADYSKHFKGTTTVGIICSDGVVMGADMRATMGTFISNSDVRKVYKIDNNLVMTIAGGVGDAQELIRIMRAQNEIYKMSENRPLSPKSAASLLSIILQQNKMMPFYVQLLVGGMEDSSETQLFSLDPVGGYLPETSYSVTGSGTEPAIGFLEESYKKGISTKEGVKLAARALAIAMKRNSATGGGMIITTITKAGFTEYTGASLEKMLGAPAK
jgi:proteasome beta subunit